MRIADRGTNPGGPGRTALPLSYSDNVPTWIVDGDHDEAIKRENTLFMADQIPGSGLLLQPGVSHFAFLQDPELCNSDLLHFLQQAERDSR
jgi:pimeloyl-ACP methyl ester carboxylesterase